jgi:lipoprotein-releasing system ATP-binding protein
MSDPVLIAENLGKSYPVPGKSPFQVFEGLHFELERGDLVAIMGASGVGKTTLLNLLGALDRPSTGRVLIDGQDLSGRSDRDIAAIRNLKIGFVFQTFHLLPEFTALENVIFPLMIRGSGKKEAAARGQGLLADVGLADKAPSRPGQLSGGEQQRVAIARALANEPRVLLADEPTGNLDWKSGERVLGLVLDLHRGKGLSSIVVTHNEKIARYCHKTYTMESGELKLFTPSRG